MTTRATTKNKNKKPLSTTLGKAPVMDKETIDISHIRKPIDTSVFGLQQVLSLFETATDEVRRYVAFECEIMFECRICRTIFRSLANFILHKRNYCTESYNRNHHKDSQEDQFIITTLEEEDPTVDKKDIIDCSEVGIDHSKDAKKNLDGVLRNLQDKQEMALITEQCLIEDASNESSDCQLNRSLNKNVVLEKITDTNSAVFQTMLENMKNELKGKYMKTELMEIHQILDNNEAVLGNDGKMIPTEYEKNADLMCTVCNQKFLTKKTLTYHVKYKHNNSRLLYQCPDCQDTFANPWSVFRHLYKIHYKSVAQVKRLRNQIHYNVIRREEQPDKKPNTTVTNQRLNLKLQENVHVENQKWMDDLESDNDLQRCGGCGRKFERKAALHSHSQFCSKRIAVCNNMKDNSTKKVQLEEKQVSNKSGILANGKSEDNIVKGALRRKAKQTYKLYRIDYVKNEEKLKDNERFCINLKKCELDEPILQNNVQDETAGILQIVADDEDEAPIPHLQSKSRHSSSDYIYVETVPPNVDSLNSNLSGENNFLIRDKIKSSGSQLTETFLFNDKQVDLEDINFKRKCVEKKEDSCASKKIKINDTAQKESLNSKSSHYVDKEKIKCIPCTVSFKSYKTLMKHMAIHFHWYRYRCKICPFKSYNKSTCEKHLRVKHDVQEVDIKSSIERLSHKETIKMSSEFTKNSIKKNKKALKLKHKNLQLLTPNESIEETLFNTTEGQTPLVDEQNSVSVEVNAPEANDSSLRDLIMEVIFGGCASSSNEGESSSLGLRDSSPKQEEDGFHGFENRTTQNETSSVLPNDSVRPIRNRVPVVQKDFLYDMTQILKSKPSIKAKDPISASHIESKDLKKIKPTKTCVKDSKLKNIEQVSSQSVIVSNNNIVSSEINITQDTNMDSENLSGKHITADCDYS